MVTETLKQCPSCHALKPASRTHRLCFKCENGSKTKPSVTVAKGTEKVVNALGETVIIKDSQQVIRIVKSRRFVGYVTMITNRGDGRLMKYWTCIRLSSRYIDSPEQAEQTLACESLHLAMCRIGLGRENLKFDSAGYHTWKTYAAALAEPDGIAIAQFGLRKEE